MSFQIFVCKLPLVFFNWFPGGNFHTNKIQSDTSLVSHMEGMTCWSSSGWRLTLHQDRFIPPVWRAVVWKLPPLYFVQGQRPLKTNAASGAIFTQTFWSKWWIDLKLFKRLIRQRNVIKEPRRNEFESMQGQRGEHKCCIRGNFIYLQRGNFHTTICVKSR